MSCWNLILPGLSLNICKHGETWISHLYSYIFILVDTHDTMVISFNNASLLLFHRHFIIMFGWFRFDLVSVIAYFLLFCI